MADHAKLSPSSAARWLTCTASVALEEQFEEKPSEYAAEGTYAHALCELEGKYAVGQISRQKLTAAKKKIRNDEYHTAECEDAASYYANFIKELVTHLETEKEEEPTVLFEQRLDLSQLAPDCFGTADCIVICGRELHVIDFKYGKGVEVSAVGNPQMQLYAAGALMMFAPVYDIERVGLTIIQPRIENTSTAFLTMQELTAWCDEVVKPKAAEAMSGSGQFEPSETACRFCKAKAECSARAEHFVQLFDEDPEPQLVANARLAELLTATKDMKTWLSEIEAVATSRLMSGEKIPGYKLVESKTRRQIPDEEAAAKALRAAGLAEEDIFTVKLAGLTVLEKLLGGKKKAAEVLDPITEKPPGKPAVAPETDKRPELQPEDLVLNAFDEEE